MPLQSTELARREGKGIVVRAEAVRLRWVMEDLVTGDGHALRCVFGCSVQALEGAAERRMLEEVFLANGAALTGGAVVGHFQSAFRTAAAAVCQNKPAADLLAASGNNALVEGIKAGGKRVAFVCGLNLLAPFDVEVSSPTLERQRTEALHRELAEERAAGQVEHFQRAAELLKQFQEIRKSAPELSAGDVLRQLNPADQGMMLQTLLTASGKEKQTAAVWVVAGASLVRIDPRQIPARSEVINLPTTLGPLRSVQPAQGGPALLVGARSGVMHVAPDRMAEVKCYCDAGVTSQFGFSRAVLWNEEIWGCHGEAGIVAWKLGETAGPAFAVRPGEMGGAGPRNLQVLDESRLIFSTKNRLGIFTRANDFRAGRNGASGSTAGTAGAHEDSAGEGTGGTKEQAEACRGAVVILAEELDSEVVAILPDVQRVIVVLVSGTVQYRNKHSMEVERSERRRGPITAAAVLPWLGCTRLLLASEGGPLVGVGIEDDLVTEYLSPHTGLRALAAGADVIAGLANDRQRLVYWRSWEPRQMAGDVFVTGLARHRGADVDI